MSPEDTRHLDDFLSNFGAEQLGHGDRAAGSNLLAMMAISLANIQRPGSGLINWDGDTITVGASLLISGSHSCSLISERVLNGLASRQNNLIARLGQRKRNIEMGTDNSCSYQSCASDSVGLLDETIMQQLFQPGAMNDQQANECWGLLVEVPPRIDVRDLHESPLVFLTGVTAAKVIGQLERCHLNRPFIHVGIDGAADFAQYQHQIPAIMDGRMAVGATAERIHGEVVVTDPTAVLGDALRMGQPSARWVSRMVWLVDGNAGPELDDGEDVEDSVALGGVVRRFESAVRIAWAQRISDRVSAPVMVKHEFTEAQAHWIAFLKRTEPEFPGITGTARSLYATLQYGLEQMVSVAKIPERFRLPSDQILALAKHLVFRMVNTRAVALRSAAKVRRRQLEACILRKLGEGPLCLRDLVRKFDSFPSERCHELLLDLEASGRLIQSRGKWQIARPALLTVPDDEGLLLEA